MAVQYREFTRSPFSGDAGELKRKVIKYCNSELRGCRILSISEAKGFSDDWYRITVWYDDEAEKYEHLMSAGASEHRTDVESDHAGERAHDAG
jgi:hypothetical protein